MIRRRPLATRTDTLFPSTTLFRSESTLSMDIGGVRTNFRMPDILAIGLGGGTRIHLDPARYESADIEDRELRVGPDSVGFHIGREACLLDRKSTRLNSSP